MSNDRKFRPASDCMAAHSMSTSNLQALGKSLSSANLQSLVAPSLPGRQRRRNPIRPLTPLRPPNLPSSECKPGCGLVGFRGDLCCRCRDRISLRGLEGRPRTDERSRLRSLPFRGRAPGRCAADRSRRRRGSQGIRIIELLNLMEAFALLLNDARPSSSTKKVTGHFLEEALGWIWSPRQWRT